MEENNLYTDKCVQGGHPISIAEIRKWLKEQETYTLRKPIRHKFKRQQTRVTGIDEQWQLV